MTRESVPASYHLHEITKLEVEIKQLKALLQEVTEYTMPAPIMKKIRAALEQKL